MSDYSIHPYRYRRGVKSVSVRCPSPDGFKSRAARLASTFGRYVGRAGGYVMTSGQAGRFDELYRAGWDVCTVTGERIAPKEPATPRPRVGEFHPRPGPERYPEATIDPQDDPNPAQVSGGRYER